MNVATKIKKYIRDNGIKQSFISEKSGLSNNQLTLSLNNKRKLEIEEYIKICNALDVDIKCFIDYKDTG